MTLKEGDALSVFAAEEEAEEKQEKAQKAADKAATKQAAKAEKPKRTGLLRRVTPSRTSIRGNK